jgi:hypothetical protein
MMVFEGWELVVECFLKIGNGFFECFLEIENGFLNFKLKF